MTRAFYGKLSLLEVILVKLKQIGSEANVPVVLATTTNESDKELCDIAEKVGCKVFRGSEDDVLDRFINAAKEYKLSKIIRVCGDNPFLLIAEISILIEQFRKAQCDYLSYEIAGTPSILTHFGLWTEAVSLYALEKAYQLTNEKIHREHVTNYIYTHPEHFKIEWNVLKNERFAKKNIRLTIDTEEDFKLTSKMYADLIAEKKDIGLAEIFNYLDEHAELKEVMKKEIEANSK